jgi:hypothetical protein
MIRRPCEAYARWQRGQLPHSGDQTYLAKTRGKTSRFRSNDGFASQRQSEATASSPPFNGGDERLGKPHHSPHEILHNRETIARLGDVGHSLLVTNIAAGGKVPTCTRQNNSVNGSVVFSIREKLDQPASHCMTDGIATLGLVHREDQKSLFKGRRNPGHGRPSVRPP